jgi:hypothetical protein
VSGTERRPRRRRRIPQFQGHRQIDLVVTSGSRSAARRPRNYKDAGTLLPCLCSPSLLAAHVGNGATEGWDERLRKRLAGSPDRTASGRRSRANGASETSHHGRRQSHGHEQSDGSM